MQSAGRREGEVNVRVGCLLDKAPIEVATAAQGGVLCGVQWASVRCYQCCIIVVGVFTAVGGVRVHCTL